VLIPRPSIASVHFAHTHYRPPSLRYTSPPAPITLTPQDQDKMSPSKAGSATAAPSCDTNTQSSPAVTEQTSPEEPVVLGLLVELQKTIIEYVSVDWQEPFEATQCKLTRRQSTSYGDMKSACLVCKQLNKIATPYLYQNMEITGEFLSTDRFSATITQKHPGLPSVKTVRVVRPSSFRPSSDFTRAACLLLSTIPKNSLARFEYVQ
jgi:hypothetical protein